MFYFPILWLLSILFCILFVFKLKRNEKKYNIVVKKYFDYKFPEIKGIRSIIRNADDKGKRRDFKLLLLYLYLTYIFFLIPFIIYFILAIWTAD